MTASSKHLLSVRALGTGPIGGAGPNRLTFLRRSSDAAPTRVRAPSDARQTPPSQSNALLVIGLSFLAGGAGRLEPRSTYLSLAQLAVAVPLLLAVALPYWTGLQRDSAADVQTTSPPWRCSPSPTPRAPAGSSAASRRSRARRTRQSGSLRHSLLLLAVGVAAAGVVSEAMTSSIADFAGAIGVSVFFASTFFVFGD